LRHDCFLQSKHLIHGGLRIVECDFKLPRLTSSHAPNPLSYQTARLVACQRWGMARMGMQAPLHLTSLNYAHPGQGSQHLTDHLTYLTVSTFTAHATTASIARTPRHKIHTVLRPLGTVEALLGARRVMTERLVRLSCSQLEHTIVDKRKAP
jgi:hypothetical protein